MPMINLCVCVVVCACVWNGNEEIEREGRNSGKRGGMCLPRQWRIVSTDRYLYGLAVVHDLSGTLLRYLWVGGRVCRIVSQKRRERGRIGSRP